jgi:hypothetical protein
VAIMVCCFAVPALRDSKFQWLIPVCKVHA